MSTRRVPAALHHELSEYASLLRALRTRDTQDVTKHLVKPSPYELSQADDEQHLGSEDAMDEMLDESSKPNHRLSFSDNLRSRSRSRDNEGPRRKKPIPRDHWTRWPLMLNDVLEPEWTLEDEVAVIASQVMRANSTSMSLQVSSGTDVGEPEDDLVVLDMHPEDDDPDHPFYIPFLTSIISNYLAAIFGRLASLTPPRPGSMQNRIEPLNWRAVIDAVVSLEKPEYLNPKVLHNVIRRLEGIYDPSLGNGSSTSSRAIDRAEQIVACADRSHRQQEEWLGTLFDQASPSSHVYPSESSSTKRTQIIIEDDNEERAYIGRRHWIAKGKRPEGDRSLRRSRRKDTTSRPTLP